MFVQSSDRVLINNIKKSNCMKRNTDILNLFYITEYSILKNVKRELIEENKEIVTF